MGDATVVQFKIFEVFEQLGPAKGKPSVPWVDYVGPDSSELTFTITGNPALPTTGNGDDGGDDKTQNAVTLWLQLWGVTSPLHKTLINGQALDGMTMPPHANWQTWMNVFTEPLLKQGQNTLQFELGDGQDTFIIASVVLTWTEIPAAQGGRTRKSPPRVAGKSKS